MNVTRKKGLTNTEPLEQAVAEILVQAFGRYGRQEARGAGIQCLQKLAERHGSYWLVCDCVVPDAGEQPAILVPVECRFVRRLERRPWSAHTETCAFFRAPQEQAAITSTYTKAASVGAQTLIGGFRQHNDVARRSALHYSSGEKRGKLGIIALRLLSQAGLQDVWVGCPKPLLSAQYQLLREVARTVELAPGITIRDWMTTYPPSYPDMLRRIEGADPSIFGASRPHAVLLGVVHDIKASRLTGAAGLDIVVDGPITIIGRTPDPPYLMVAVTARPAPAAAATIVKAYLQPILSNTSLMAVDNGDQRHTFGQIYSACVWATAKSDAACRIEKPVFGEAVEGQRLYLPDFCVYRDSVLKAVIASGVTSSPFQIRQLPMDLAPKGVPHPVFIHHRIASSESDDQAEIDRTFRRAVIGAVMR